MWFELSQSKLIQDNTTGCTCESAMNQANYSNRIVLTFDSNNRLAPPKYKRISVGHFHSQVQYFCRERFANVLATVSVELRCRLVDKSSMDCYCSHRNPFRWNHDSRCLGP